MAGHTKKMLLFIVLTQFLFCVSAFANSSVNSSSIVIRQTEAKALLNKISKTEAEFTTEGYIPRIIASNNKDFETNLNNKINDYCTEVFTSAINSKYVKSLSFKYSEEKSPKSKSLILEIEITSTTKKKQIKAFTFDASTGKELSLTDFLGSSGTSIANSVINSTITKEPDKYNINFSKISDARNFSVSGNDLYVIYSNTKFLFKLDRINNKKLNKNEYFNEINSSYNTKLIPLRKVCEGLGFLVDWTKDGIKVSKDKDVIVLETNKNSYIKNSLTPRTLICPPVVQSDGLTYVPISFFEQLLDVFYYIDDDENIEFSFYVK